MATFIDFDDPQTYDLSPLNPWRITYPSGDLDLTGYFFLPDGDGPFPAIVFNHGSAGLIPHYKIVADVLTGLGYAVLFPIRRGANTEPGRGYKAFLEAPEYSVEWGEQMVEGLRGECDDVIAAIDWLKRDPRIDPDRLVVMGSSFGGVMVLITVGRGNSLRAGVSFAGPSITWPHNAALRQELRTAVRNAATPLMLLQAQNDHSLEPTYELGRELHRAGKPHEVRIYETLGATPWEGHFLCIGGTHLWARDVERFLQTWVSPRWPSPRPSPVRGRGCVDVDVN